MARRIISRALFGDPEHPTDARDDLPGCSGQTADNYEYRQWAHPLTAISILKACDCYDYQACETDDYAASLAKSIIDAIRHRAIRRLAGYDDAAGWEFRRPRAGETPRAIAEGVNERRANSGRA